MKYILLLSLISTTLLSNSFNSFLKKATITKLGVTLTKPLLSTNKKYNCEYIKKYCDNGISKINYEPLDDTVYQCTSFVGWKFDLNDKEELRLMESNGSLSYIGIDKKKVYLQKAYSAFTHTASEVEIFKISKTKYILKPITDDREMRFISLYMINTNSKKSNLISDISSNYKNHLFLKQGQLYVINDQKCNNQDKTYLKYTVVTNTTEEIKTQDCSELKKQLKNHRAEFDKFDKILKEAKNGQEIKDVLNVSDITCRNFLDINKGSLRQ